MKPTVKLKNLCEFYNSFLIEHTKNGTTLHSYIKMQKLLCRSVAGRFMRECVNLGYCSKKKIVKNADAYKFNLVAMEPIHAKKAIELARKSQAKVANVVRDNIDKERPKPLQQVVRPTIIDEKNRLSTIEDYIVENIKTVEQLKRYAVDLLLSEIGLNKMLSIIESKQKAGKLTNKQAHDLRKLINAKINIYKKSDIKSNRALYVFGLKIWEIK